MKKAIAALLALCLALSALTACSATPQRQEDGTLHIVATIFPEYDWVRNILGDNPAGAELTLLLDNGVDMHSFQPSAADILNISTCDLFLYVGGESDQWVADALAEAVNPDMVVVNLMDALGDQVREEEIVEGMEADGDEAEDGPAYDEHVWLSLRSAAALCDAIEGALEAVDPDHADIYRANTDDYQAKLSALDAAYQAAVDDASQKTLLFGDRFPFRYLTEDYGLSYYAAFVGCSAETEASFETITFLAQKVDELGLHSVLTIDGSDGRLADTIVQATRTKDQEVLTLNSLQSTSGQDIEAGVTYLSLMEDNLAVLERALQ